MDRVTKNFNEALSALNRRDLKRAEEKFRRVIHADKSHVPALNLLTVALMGLGRYADAERFIARAITLNRSSDISFYNYGLISKELGKDQQAYEQFSEALKLNPNVPETWNNRGTVCNRLQNYDRALSDFDRAISLNDLYADAHTNRGKSLLLLKRHDEALAAYDKAISIKPDLAEAWLGRGNVSRLLCYHEDALAAFERALSIKSNLAQAWLGRGDTLLDQNRYGDAVASFDRALSLEPKSEEAWFGRGDVFTVMNRHEDAFAAYDRAFSLNPDLALAEGARLHAKMRCCDWSDYRAECDHLVASVRSGKPAAQPFHLLAVDCSAGDLLRCAEMFSERQDPPMTYALPKQGSRQGSKIRLAYLSSELREHATSHLMTGLFEAHDRSRFDVIALSTGVDDGSQIRKRLERSFTDFVDLSALTDVQAAAQIGRLGIDILVDLNGFTRAARTGILKSRPAPIQVNYLAYPGTMASCFIDYIIADRTIVPAEDKPFYREKVVWLPHSYQANDRKREIANRKLTRQDYGLPESAFVFCSFNNSYKINPATFDCWMAILAQAPDSVLWLLKDREIATNNLRREARQRGVDPDRLVFAERVPPIDHLARHRLADLFLDTLPCNAHTTASDALWAGLPVLTRIGQTFAGRVAASLLNAIGLPELITQSRGEYETLAIELANDREKLLNITRKLERNRLTTALFDTSAFAQYVEAAYEKMFLRHRNGLPPDDIDIQPNEG
jgi:predicted O-linked N-acetylglucosamine transferase (SPINDLY family)